MHTMSIFEKFQNFPNLGMTSPIRSYLSFCLLQLTEFNKQSNNP